MGPFLGPFLPGSPGGGIKGWVGGTLWDVACWGDGSIQLLQCQASVVAGCLSVHLWRGCMELGPWTWLSTRIYLVCGWPLGFPHSPELWGQDSPR